MYAAHLTPYLQEATNELESKLRSTRQDNATLMATIREQRAELEHLLNGLEVVVHDIEGSVQAMRSDEQGGLAELRDDMWQMEQELATTR